MATTDERRDILKAQLRPYSDVISKVRRVYFDSPSIALADKHEVEFDIKSQISDRHQIPFRSVVFTGSAQLGFSPHKDTEFVVGSSDLDVVCIDARLYQHFWGVILRVTRSYNDLSGFKKSEHVARLQDHILKRGMILFDYMPKCRERTDEIAFLNNLSRSYRHMFGRVSLAVYINESAFCSKQISALSNIFGNQDAE